jgi:DNA-binding NarL/FixJ family response regulator
MKLNLPHSLKIHICDDHPIVIDGLVALLSAMEKAQVTYSNSKEALFNFIKQHKIDLLLLDINVKSCNMLVFVPEVRRLQPELKIILFTNYNSKEVIKEVVKYQIEGFLDKMVPSDVVLQCIHAVLNQQKYLSF